MAANVLFGALLAGTLLFVVPTLALNGAVAAAVASVIGAGGLSALWVVYRRELRRRDLALADSRAAGALHRWLIERGADSYVLVDRLGAVRFASPGVARILDVDPHSLEGNDQVIELIRPADRRRVLQEFARVRRQPGAAVSLEVGATGPDGQDVHLDVRATNLIDEPGVDGILLCIRDITPRKRFEDEIQHLAYYDALTGLANRRLFFEQGRRALSMARRRDAPACVLYIDLDDFKQVNDVLGHATGDELLKRAADGLRGSLRETDVMARISGDEFAVVLTEIRDPDAAGHVATRVLDSLPISMVSNGKEVPVTASIGLAFFPDDGTDLEALLKAADLAMYRAKTNQLGIQYYRPELRARHDDRRRLEQDLRRGLERHEFQLHYQPVVDLRTGAVVGVEALSRWRHFTHGMVAAAEFISLAETSGLIGSLDRWAVGRATHQWTTDLEGRRFAWVAVNLSAPSLADRQLTAFIRDLIAEHALEPGVLVLEMPDFAVGTDPAAFANLMWELKRAGAAIALDDYGAGRTSFAQLRTLPIDILKLAPAFVHQVARDEGDARMAQGVIAIAHGVRMKVLAKGVERPDQLDWLRAAGCDLVQGYITGPPVPAGDLLDPKRGGTQGEIVSI